MTIEINIKNKDDLRKASVRMVDTNLNTGEITWDASTPLLPGESKSFYTHRGRRLEVIELDLEELDG